MATGIDHVVIAVNDLEHAVADYTAAGFTVTPGGEHTNGVTHNALVAFTDGSYFELIAWKKADDTIWAKRLEAGEGFVDFALRSADLEAEVVRLREAGLDVPDPEPGGRTRPDGQAVEWQTVRFDPQAHSSLPFYCHSTNDRTLRVPFGEETVHANGVTGIHKIFIGVADLERASLNWEKVAGITFDRDAHVQPDDNKWQQFRVGTFNIVLIEPGVENSELAKSITARGEIPIEITLRSTNQEGSSVDPKLTHGAKLAIMEAEHTIEIPDWEPEEEA